jgi:hypothetical protein
MSFMNPHLSIIHFKKHYTGYLLFYQNPNLKIISMLGLEF